ncbi:aminodeoxychorismate lyase [Nakamurella silvestris]|nr:aminodeoxychorismate lyase [Nakamurella silvestris]
MTDRVLALLDGTLLDPAAPFLRADDYGVLRGDGIFETTLVVDGAPRDLDEHLLRLAISARMTDLELPGADRWRTGITAAIGAWTGGRDMVLRLIATRGPEGANRPTCFVMGGPVAPRIAQDRAEGVRVLTLERGFSGTEAAALPWLLAGAKTLSYAVNMAAQRHAAANGADDVVFVGSDGHVLEAPTATVVIAQGRHLVTPPLQGILAGITVERLWPAARAAGFTTETAPLTVQDLHAADGVWLLSSVRLIAPVVRIDGADRPAGAVTAELAAALDVPPAR